MEKEAESEKGEKKKKERRQPARFFAEWCPERKRALHACASTIFPNLFASDIALTRTTLHVQFALH